MCFSGIIPRTAGLFCIPTPGPFSPTVMHFGSGKLNYNQLQVIQNRACRIISVLKKRDDVVEHMKSLHWLRINERILFKVLLLIYKCIHGLAPTYLNDIISFNNISLTRRNSLHISLCQASHPQAF